MVRGILKDKNPIIVTNPIKTDKQKNIYKDAETHILCLGTHIDPRCSLVLAEPKTGRTHQIRRHLRDINHPIIHDGDHGDSRVNRFWRENRNMKRLGLHALDITFSYKNTHYSVSCPLFLDHHSVLQKLDFWESIQHTIPTLQKRPIV